MDFHHSPRALALRQQLEAFMQQYLLPYNAAWHRSVQEGIYPPPFLEDLKALAREAGLWNLFLPGLQEDEPGTRLGHLDYAPLAETMGRLPWAAEVFNCSAPDTGNMELLHRFATPGQRVQWLMPLLEGRIRSAFAMSEPDVASSDPTNLQTTVRREGGQLVLNGRKWFITGAAHPNCRLLVVMCRNDEAPGEGDLAGAHHRHSMARTASRSSATTAVCVTCQPRASTRARSAGPERSSRSPRADRSDTVKMATRTCISPSPPIGATPWADDCTLRVSRLAPMARGTLTGRVAQARVRHSTRRCAPPRMGRPAGNQAPRKRGVQRRSSD